MFCLVLLHVTNGTHMSIWNNICNNNASILCKWIYSDNVIVWVWMCFIGLHNLLLAAEYVSDLVYFSFLTLTLNNESGLGGDQDETVKDCKRITCFCFKKLVKVENIFKGSMIASKNLKLLHKFKSTRKEAEEGSLNVSD